MIKKMEKLANVPCTTTATSVLAGLQALDVENVAIATPSTSDINESAADFLKVVV